ncbi:transglutaminase family protein [Luteolibacter marinus]|uniref:transglutaminase family protein n=1 Tax=Luteolibacter marinus TaxID=2776705 RepID=UPI001868B560|nr:transglutaminase family protein [Luteolibacter marinus]
MNQTHLLRIVHRTHYHYASPVTFQTHRLVVRPREGHDLRVEKLELSITPLADVVWTRDIFGNSIAHAHFKDQGTELTFDVDVVVRRFFPLDSPPPETHSPSPYPLEYDTLEHGIVTGYLTPVYAEETAAVQEFIHTLPNPADFPSAEAFVVQLAGIIHGKIGYQRREQKGVQTPATTLSLGTGSCRDVATLMMETLRHLGIAARFASGYLDCPATRAARGSTHAWTEAYFPQLGWRGFDPTTGKPCDHRHIVTGTSHHPRGVMPVSGRYFGATGAFLSMTVGVEFSTPL